ncbi:hypothetical protein CHARACLAT_004187 [Characodon lateralis]|uniref:Uncharacterized protein n=1 Tax=Characodon lateralis TaxID=208331 RepID=A0ABU7DDJ7_9TELE|nr:hypothetical protein [Characodon lateralis]
MKIKKPIKGESLSTTFDRLCICLDFCINHLFNRCNPVFHDSSFDCHCTDHSHHQADLDFHNEHVDHQGDPDFHNEHVDHQGDLDCLGDLYGHQDDSDFHIDCFDHQDDPYFHIDHVDHQGGPDFHSDPAGHQDDPYFHIDHVDHQDGLDFHTDCVDHHDLGFRNAHVDRQGDPGFHDSNPSGLRSNAGNLYHYPFHHASLYHYYNSAGHHQTSFPFVLW